MAGETGPETETHNEPKIIMQKWLTYGRRMGPAWIISAVACGPATLASVSLAGATYGYELLWVVILSAVFGATAQYLAARIGVIEARGIIAATEARLGRAWAWVLAVDAVLATYLAAIFLMNALVGVTSLVTGLKTPWWGVAYGVLMALGLIRGGYRWLETACKALVGVVVACFLITLLQADIAPAQLLRGILPGLPPDVNAALMMAAILGGAVHITIIGMHTYNTNARHWTAGDLGLARFDTVVSMGFAFGLYSLAIFLVAAAVLHPHGVQVKTATDAALGLGPLLGKSAMGVFLAGLWAATFSTILPTFLGRYLFHLRSDALGPGPQGPKIQNPGLRRGGRERRGTVHQGQLLSAFAGDAGHGPLRHTPYNRHYSLPAEQKRRGRAKQELGRPECSRPDHPGP